MTTSTVLQSAKIKVVGIGGAGCKVVARLVQSFTPGVDFMAVDTSASHLISTGCRTQILLSKRKYGLKNEDEADLVRSAVEERDYELKAAFDEVDLVFLIAGLGSVTGTAAIPLLSEIARQKNALTIAVVTKPFPFEGKHRSLMAAEGLQVLLKRADSVIAVDNERLFEYNPKILLEEAFTAIDEALADVVCSITAPLVSPGLVNISLGSLRTVMKNAGQVWVSFGRCTGKYRARDVTEKVLAGQLMGIELKKPGRMLLSFTGNEELTLAEVELAVDRIRKASPDANIIFGVSINQRLENEIRLTLIASGISG